MTVGEAYSNFKKAHSDLVILSCYEYNNYFVFHAVSSEYANDNRTALVFDSLFSVNKKDGKMSLFDPLDISKDEFDDGIKLPIEMFDVSVNELPKYDHIAVSRFINSVSI